MHPHIGMIVLTTLLVLFALRVVRRIIWGRHFYRHGYGWYGPHGYYGYHGYYGPWGRNGCGDSFYY